MITHEHPDAFRLMTFECERCGIDERIWNSRDGMSEFTVGCAHCFGGTMRRNTFESKSVYVPDHKPSPGERIFVDLTEERAHYRAGESVAVCISADIERGEVTITDPWGQIQKLAAELFGDGHKPDLITVGE